MFGLVLQAPRRLPSRAGKRQDKHPVLVQQNELHRSALGAWLTSRPAHPICEWKPHRLHTVIARPLPLRAMVPERDIDALKMGGGEVCSISYLTTCHEPFRRRSTALEAAQRTPQNQNTSSERSDEPRSGRLRSVNGECRSCAVQPCSLVGLHEREPRCFIPSVAVGEEKSIRSSRLSTYDGGQDSR